MINYIKHYQLEEVDFKNLQQELQNFYSLDLPYSNPIDDQDRLENKKIEIPKVAVSHSSFNINIIEKHNLTTLSSVILKNAKDYLPDANLEINECWATNMKPGSAAQLHSHRHALLAGVYYHDVDESDSHIQFFIDELLVPITPKIGKMLIWPGELLHEIPIKTLTSNRYSIAFSLSRKK